MTEDQKREILTLATKERLWAGIVLHHSFSPDSNTRDWNGIVKYHTSYRIDFNVVSEEEFKRRELAKDGKHFEKPWRDVGYHGGIEFVDGKVIYNVGRPLVMTGAHAGVAGASNVYNEKYIGLCCIGNFDTAPPHIDMWMFTLEVVRAFMGFYTIPKTHVIGHREVYDKLGVPRQKTCPGSKFDMELLREEL